VIDLVVRGENDDFRVRTFDTATDTWNTEYSIGGTFKSAPAIVSYFDDAFHIYGRGTDDAIHQKYWQGNAGRWEGWAWLGGSAGSSPAVTSWYTSNIELSYRGTDGALWQRGWNGTRWDDWYSHGVAIDGAPAMTTERAGQLQIFARQGGQVVRRVYDNDAWGGVASIGDPDAAVEPQDRVAVVEGGPDGTMTFVRDNAGVIRYSSRSGFRQTVWTALSGRVDSAPAAVRRRDGTVDVFALIGSVIQHKTISPTGAQSSWRTTGVSSPAAPAASMRRWGSQVGSVIDLVVRGVGNDVRVRSFDTETGRWNTEYSLGGTFTSSPAVMSYYDESIYIVARGTDDATYMRYWDGHIWTREWASLGGVATSSPAIISWFTSNIEVAVRGTDGAFYRKSWDPVAEVWSGWLRTDVTIDAAPTLSSERAGQLKVYGRQNEYVIRRAYDNDAWGDWVWLGNPSLRLVNP
jgi:hypothetical protein